uniref:non-specific serine/threonine protein kinase n=1 Tax=Ciona savignyi TaxID=51511 RepID=H2ZNB9_CIOSA
MLDALQYMHSRKVLHRDLKPGNILLVNKDVKLADFGVSKQLLLSTYQGQAAGTFLYMSPEMLKGQKYNAKSDIWSLGCVFYELFTLRPICHALGAMNCLLYMTKVQSGVKMPDLNDNRYNELFQSMMDYNVKTRPNATTLFQDKVFAKFGGSGVCPDSLKISIEIGTLTEQRVGAVVLWVPVPDNLAKVTTHMTTLGISQDFNLKAKTAT